MTAGQPYYSTRTLHGLPSVAEEVVQVNVQNNWDALAEIAVASYPESCPQLDHLALLLESHGIIVHRVSAPRPPHTYLHSATRSSLFIPDPYACPTRSNGAANGTAREKTHANARPLSLFPQSAALVYGTRVIEVPPTSSVPRFSSDDSSLSSTSQSDQGATPEHGNNALFNLLENARIEVIRWPVTSPSSANSFKASEKKLVDIEEVSDTTDEEDEGPRFSPSDILVLSPTLLITRLSSCTNNKGLEYLWSVLSQPAKSPDPSRRINHQHGRTPAMQQVPPNPPRATTTLLVRVTEPDPPTTNTSTMPGAYSPRASINSINQVIPKKGPTSYTPLCRALVPIDGRVMLYDPALVADGEARRLKSVLDRVQEGSRGSGGGSGGGSGELRELFAKSSKRDSTMSYGTFGSVDCSDDEGWRFISVEGLHQASILVVSPSLALLSPAPAASPNSSSPNEDVLSNVSQVLGSLGIRTVSLPFSELNEKGGGVRDAVMVLRRESFAEASDDGYAEREQQNAWDQATPGEEATEGCFEAITASISTFFCGLFANFTSSSSTSESESDVSR
ncbi:hypothetical protein JB92DRAFT_3139318 [Gautieria morchelliformis]|nr:hypothetical protein JB92DRAFT_3139318 [Gautieria morchelliformis]